LNWTWLFARLGIVFGILALLFFSQRFWYRSLWRVTSNWGRTWLRVSVRLLYLIALLLTILSLVDALRMDHGRILPRGNMISMFIGLWFSSALLAFVAVKCVRGVERLWHLLCKPALARPIVKNRPAAPSVEVVADPSRRYFFRTAAAVAGAAPCLGVMYGFAAERLRYQVRRVELPIPNLPPQLDGMRILQLSDIHLSGYMTRESVRRAVDMANGLGADLAVVTGDLITGSHDPIAECIEEIQRLRAPLGIYGCNGNHEIYARAEDTAQRLYAQAGMKLLRRENVQLTFNGVPFNLIGVDYQRERTPSGRRMRMLADLDPLVRRDMPNILLSHNPNSFHRAAELGIELTLAGHTHGGQVQVEILDHRLSPARFITDYIAGLYQRPLFAPAPADNARASAALDLSAAMRNAPLASIYVNRGIGTVGAPVRLGVPPEIALLTLRRA
jgi:uncharacterized protein